MAPWAPLKSATGTPGKRAVKWACVCVTYKMAAKSTGIDIERNYVAVTQCMTIPAAVSVLVCLAHPECDELLRSGGTARRSDVASVPE